MSHLSRFYFCIISDFVKIEASRHTDHVQFLPFFSKSKQSKKFLYSAFESPWHALHFEYMVVGVISSRFRCGAKFLQVPPLKMGHLKFTFEKRLKIHLRFFSEMQFLF